MTATAFSALLIILGGAALRQFGLVRVDDAELLVRVVIYLAMPALILLILVRSPLEPAFVLVPLVALAVHAILVVASIGAGKAMSLDRPGVGAMIVAASVGNTGFFGVPLIASSGPSFSPIAAVMYDTFATGLITWTSTVAVGSAYGTATEGSGVDWKRVGKALMLPPNWALVAGLTLNFAGVRHLPEPIERPLVILGGAVLPLVMMYVGIMLRLHGIRAVWSRVAAVVVLRLFVAGALGFALAWLVGIRGIVLHTVAVMAAMPTAIMSLVIGGGQYKLNADIIAGAILVTTILCTATLPLIRWIVS